MFFGESQISHTFALTLIALVKTLGLEKYRFALLVIQKCLDFVVYFGSGESHIGYNIFLEQVYLIHLTRGNKPEYLISYFTASGPKMHCLLASSLGVQVN